MEENFKTRRRWFRFSLRTMLVLVTVLCVYLGWAMNWIRQRKDYLANPPEQLNLSTYEAKVRRAPIGLWPLGTAGVYSISVWPVLKSIDPVSANNAIGDIENIVSLFPESDVMVFVPTKEDADDPSYAFRIVPAADWLGDEGNRIPSDRDLDPGHYFSPATQD